jgi:hypothetical protein
MEKKKKNVRNIKKFDCKLSDFVREICCNLQKNPKVMIDSIRAFDVFVSIHPEVHFYV